MSKESVILIDEMILPDTDVHWYAASIDLTMMCGHAARERTQRQWEDLLDSVRLKLAKKLTYNTLLYESVMVAVPTQLKPVSPSE